MSIAPRAEHRRVFLHVGSPKTGTTFLQSVLWSQRDRAEQQGLRLPMERFNDHFLASLDLRGLAGRPEHPPRAEGMWDRMVAEAEAWPGTVLISHELFAAATAEQAQHAVSSFGERTEVHVVVTARDLVRQITAEWQEHVKHRSTKTLVEFVEDLRADRRRKNWFWRVQDFADVVDRWGRLLPSSRLHVVTVPPAGDPPDTLWRRFSSLLGLDPESFETEVPRANFSLGGEQTEVLRRVNLALGDRLPIPGPYAGVVKNVFAQQILAARTGTRLSLDVRDTEFAIERSRDIVDRLKGLDVDVVGSLSELVPDEAVARAAAAEKYADPSAEVLLEESVAAMAGLLIALADKRAQRRYEQLTRELRQAPLRFALLRASERHPVLMKARRVYQRRAAVL